MEQGHVLRAPFLIVLELRGWRKDLEGRWYEVGGGTLEISEAFAVRLAGLREPGADADLG